MIKKMYIALHVKQLSEFSEAYCSQQIFEQYPNIKFHENPSSGKRVVPCGHTEGLTDRQTNFDVQVTVHRDILFDVQVTVHRDILFDVQVTVHRDILFDVQVTVHRDVLFDVQVTVHRDIFLQ